MCCVRLQGNAKMPTLIQHIGAITAFEEAPPAHGLSHLCCTAAIRHDRIYALVITEAGHLLEYTRPESEIVAKVSVVTVAVAWLKNQHRSLAYFEISNLLGFVHDL